MQYAELQTIVQSIRRIDAAWLEKARRRMDSLTMPRGSLGRLAEAAVRYAAIHQNTRPNLERKQIVVFAGDHGVVAEGVSAYPREVTRQMVENFIRGRAAINVLARHAGAEVRIVDAGVDHDFDLRDGLVDKKEGFGTGNIVREPAMSRDAALRAMGEGVAMAREAVQNGCDIVGTGDMGIGNTTPSSAIAAVVLNLPAADVTGRGTGINDTALQNKISVVEKAVLLHRPHIRCPVDVLARLGGYEIAGIAGLVLGSAAQGLPVVLDGFISTAGALIAHALAPNCAGYLFAAHRSVERGHRAMLDSMGLEPMLDLGFRLGEGTGAALGISLIEAGAAILREMLTFEEAGVSDKS